MAVLTSIAYARTRVRRGRTGQRVRLTATITAVTGSVFNLTWKGFGNYARTSQRLGGPYYAHSNYATPPFEHDTLIAGAATCTESRFAYHPGGRVALICNNSGTLEERHSDDSGLSWNTALTAFSAASHPDITAGKGGEIVSLAYRAGEIVGTRQVPAGATPSSEFTLKDTASVDIAVEDSVFRLVEAANGWWWIHLRPAGAGTTRLLFSTDIDTGPTQTFAVTSGAVTGITSGLHPGCCHAEPTGSLYAYARLADGTGRITVRHPGDVSWATPVAMVDSASASILFADTPFSIAAAWEGPARLILAAVISGESAVSEWWSADPAGVSWTRLIP